MSKHQAKQILTNQCAAVLLERRQKRLRESSSAAEAEREPRGVLRSSPVLYSAQIQSRSRVPTWLEGVLLLLEGRGRLEEAARVLLLLDGEPEEAARVLLLLDGGPEEAVGKHLPAGG
jgi:hypothetical protein